MVPTVLLAATLTVFITKACSALLLSFTPSPHTRQLRGLHHIRLLAVRSIACFALFLFSLFNLLLFSFSTSGPRWSCLRLHLFQPHHNFSKIPNTFDLEPAERSLHNVIVNTEPAGQPRSIRCYPRSYDLRRTWGIRDKRLCRGH